MVGALSAGSKILDTWLDKLGITINTGLRQKTNSFVGNSKEEGVGKLKEEN